MYLLIVFLYVPLPLNNHRPMLAMAKGLCGVTVPSLVTQTTSIVPDAKKVSCVTISALDAGLVQNLS